MVNWGETEALRVYGQTSLSLLKCWKTELKYYRLHYPSRRNQKNEFIDNHK
jgi:hypothetical protein